ncbi:MAG: GDP-mannose 4,6-dehydratase [Deltaproteobacteria bacterium]|nr:GDP-mannose 4,6-dehydratase [bacterium]MCB9487145.1 GDP-mannose 4,6-dehydratase [Deltaproteobacteria bacterium]
MLGDFYRDKRVLITGGLGFIGSSLAHRLVSFGARVTLVDSLIPEYGGNMANIDGIADKVVVNIADVRDAHSMNYLVRDRDIIFNLAGTLSHVDSMNDPYTDLQINCVSQLSILEACRRYNPGVSILFAGTRGQYGRAQYLPVDEKHPMHPTDVNGINNVAGEAYHILYSEVYGIRACSLRLTNTYGPRHQMRHHRQGIINWFARLILEGREVTIYGDGTQIRDANYIDDVVDAFLLAAASEETTGQVYNLGGTPASLIDIVETMIDLHGGTYRLVAFPEDAKTIEIGDYHADYGKIRDALGWAPRIDLREGLARTLDFYDSRREAYFGESGSSAK